MKDLHSDNKNALFSQSHVMSAQITVKFVHRVKEHNIIGGGGGGGGGGGRGESVHSYNVCIHYGFWN